MEFNIGRRFFEIERKPKRSVGTSAYEAAGKNKIGDAYFTVEAALVLPVVMSTILFVIFMLLFQYNRCLLEQDLGAVALWGSRQEASDVTELEEQIRERIAGMYHDKYVAWEITELEASLDKNIFSVQGGGRITFPVSRWILWSGSDAWKMEAHYSYSRLSPVTFIRLCHGLKQLLKEQGADESIPADVNTITER